MDRVRYSNSSCPHWCSQGHSLFYFVQENTYFLLWLLCKTLLPFYQLFNICTAFQVHMRSVILGSDFCSAHEGIWRPHSLYISDICHIIVYIRQITWVTKNEHLDKFLITARRLHCRNIGCRKSRSMLTEGAHIFYVVPSSTTIDLIALLAKCFKVQCITFDLLF